VLLQVLVLAESNDVRHKTRNRNQKCGELMPKKKAKKQKAKESMVLDIYEGWLAKQPVKRVKGKRGFISAVEGTS
jgi:hypothetical protein